MAIEKKVTILLTDEEINSPEPIEIKIVVTNDAGEDITYTITYPKQ